MTIPDEPEIEKIESPEELEQLFIDMAQDLQSVSEEVTDEDGDHLEAELLINTLRADLDRIEAYIQEKQPS